MIRYLFALLALLFHFNVLAENAHWIQQKAKVPEWKAESYSVMIENAADKYRIDERYIYALILKESTYKQSVVTGKGQSVNVGLMQIQPRYHRPSGKYTGQSLLKPEVNIDTGVRILAKELSNCKGDYRCALEQYNRSSKKKQYASKIIKLVRSM